MGDREDSPHETEDSDTADTDSDDKSGTDFSLGSWFGSFQDSGEEEGAGGTTAGRESVDSDSDGSSGHPWLPETQDMRRTRRFLADPGPLFHHSTDSESESDN